MIASKSMWNVNGRPQSGADTADAYAPLLVRTYAVTRTCVGFDASRVRFKSGSCTHT